MAKANNTIYNDLSVPKGETANGPNVRCCKYFDKVPARLILYCMSLSGFMVSYMMRTDMNVAIVSMVKHIESFEVLNSSCNAGRMDFTNKSAVENFTWKPVDVEFDYDERLDWSSDIQSYVLAAFYWTYLATQILGAMLAARFGSKFTYGAGQFCTAICTLLIPVACDRHYAVVILLRSLQGFFSGVTWPAMFNLMAQWVPVPERTRFVSCLQGYNLGIGFNYPLCGYLITYLGWKSVFYTTGTIGVAWSIVWYFLAFDSPDSHPRISPEERRYIKENTADVIATGGIVPWVKILTSMPVWAITISGFGWIWVNYVFIIGGPTYLSHVQGFNIRQSGILSGAPFLVSFPVALLFCYFADRIINYKWLSATNTRKLFTCLGQVVPGVMIIIMGYLECETGSIIAVWFVAVTMPTAMYAGTMPNVTEIAPSYAGHVVAVVQTIYMFASFISPLVTGYFTRDGNTVPAWQSIFNLSAGLSITTYVIYAIWGTSEVQSWNSGVPVKSKPHEEERMLENTTPGMIKTKSSVELTNGKQQILDDKF